VIEVQIQDDERLSRILVALKALAEPNRLRAVAAIAERPRTGSELCELLDLGAATVSHHMARLESAGIVNVTREGQRRRYTLDGRGMQRLASSASAEPVHRADREEDDDASAFFSGGRLTSIPVKRKKRVAVLRRLMSGFEAGRAYSEREVNAILGRSHDDVATLRRELVGYGFLSRSRGTYHVATELPPRDANVAQEVAPDEHAWLAALIEAAKTGDSRSPL
jgi:DNA-binding MarR family transcriptional regulator